MKALILSYFAIALISVPVLASNQCLFSIAGIGEFKIDATSKAEALEKARISCVEKKYDQFQQQNPMQLSSLDQDNDILDECINIQCLK